MFGYSLDPDLFKNLDSPAGAAALVNLCGAVLLAVTGWIITVVIAWATGRITKGQLNVAQSKLLLDLMEKRIECKDLLMAAIQERTVEVADMMKGKVIPGMEAYKNFEYAKKRAGVLFAGDVMAWILEIEEALQEKENLVPKKRRNEFTQEDRETLIGLSSRVERNRRGLENAIDGYSYLGDVRVPKGRKPRQSVKAALLSSYRRLNESPPEV